MKNLNIDNGINEDWTYDNLTPQRKAYVEAVVKYADLIHIDCDKDVFCRTELRAISTAYKKKRWIPNWITHDKERRAGTGEFYLPEVKELFAKNLIQPYGGKIAIQEESKETALPMSQRLAQPA